MKYGNFLENNKELSWKEFYMDYENLKNIIFDLASSIENNNTITNSNDKDLSQELFFKNLNSELKKVEEFTKSKVSEIRSILKKVESRIGIDDVIILKETVESVGSEFLKLEKFVNINVTGFHKILKKHDRHLPNPCKSFYVTRLHEQSWARGDYSDVIVAMSRIYSSIRGDISVEAIESEKQDFVRSTRKYWVHTDNISKVKHIIVQHLPIYLQDDMKGETDSQLVNSVYLDNKSMELYHGRLDKTPGAIALRMRWYGTGTPEIVFVERKTHRESWCGEVSVKERFIVKEDQVQSIISGKFEMDKELNRLKSKGKNGEVINNWLELATEITQAIDSKILTPTMRTQYMRTAFQIPNDATVRISLDTNLCMITEGTDEVNNGERWYRDPKVPVPFDEITRFPHAVLEVKLQLEGEGKTPEWVEELIESGMLHVVHKFSKFIHGCAVLLPDEVSAVPYWIDDPTLKHSIVQSGASKLFENDSGANVFYSQLLPHNNYYNDLIKTNKIKSRSGLPILDLIGNDECASIWCNWAKDLDVEQFNKQKIEPKIFFANERTFMKWLSMAVLLSSVSTGILAFTETESKAQIWALAMLPVSLLLIFYPLKIFYWRSEKIRNRDPSRWDDPQGPVLLTSFLIIAMICLFVFTLSDTISRTNI